MRAAFPVSEPASNVRATMGRPFFPRDRRIAGPVNVVVVGAVVVGGAVVVVDAVVVGAVVVVATAVVVTGSVVVVSAAVVLGDPVVVTSKVVDVVVVRPEAEVSGAVCEFAEHAMSAAVIPSASTPRRNTRSS